MIDWQTVLVGIVVVGIVVVSILARMYFGPSLQPSQLTLVNRSSETISAARLIQGSSELTLTPLKVGQSHSTDFVPREGPIALIVTFASGHTRSANNVGYLAVGLPVTVVFDVTDSNVALRAILKRNVGAYSRR